jgi:hypothetical protein
MEEPWDEIMGPPPGKPADYQPERHAPSRDPPETVIRSVAPGSSPPPAALFRSSASTGSVNATTLPADAAAVGISQRWSQYEADPDSTRAATSQAVYMASNAALLRSEHSRAASSFAADDMEVSAALVSSPNDVYMQQFRDTCGTVTPRSFDPQDDEDGDDKSTDSAIGREYDARHHDHIRQEALRMLEVADADANYSVHRTITGGFMAQPKPLGQQRGRAARSALQGLNFVANANRTKRFGNYTDVTSTQTPPTRDDLEYGEFDRRNDCVVDVIGLENRCASTAAASTTSESAKSWSSRYSIDSTMLAMSGGAMKQKLDRMDRDHSMERFSAGNLFRSSPTKSPKIFGSGFDFRQNHVFGKQKVTIPTDNLQPVWNGTDDSTETPLHRAKTWQEQLYYKKQQQRRWLLCLALVLLCVIVPLVSILSVRRSRTIGTTATQNNSSSNTAGQGTTDNGSDNPTSESDMHQPVTFLVATDTPHTPEQEKKLKQDLATASKKASFAVHLGNIQDPKVTNCTDETYVHVASLLEDASPLRMFVVPGQQDWNDCPDPDAAWTSWTDNFELLDEKWRGVGNVEDIHMYRQKHIFENWGFVEQGVLFLGLHIVNGQVPDAAEFADRNDYNYRWVMGMSIEHRMSIRAVVVFGNGYEELPENKQLFDRLKHFWASYEHPSLYVHSWKGTEATGTYGLFFADLDPVPAVRVKNDPKKGPVLITVGFGENPFTLP